MQQRQDAKDKHPDCIIFFRLGDFYEMFGPDAIIASKILGITLTARNKSSENSIPLAWIPHHSYERYLNTLVENNYKVAICEQTSDPKLPGIVQREVVKIITPGTYNSNQSNNNNNFLVSLSQNKKWFGIAIADISTGEITTTLLNDFSQLQTELFKVRPKEIILPQKLFRDQNLKKELEQNYANIYHYQDFNQDHLENLLNFFKINSLNSFGIEKNQVEIIAACSNLIEYIQETQKIKLQHLQRIQLYTPYDYMLLDQSTIRNLELVQTNIGGEYNSSLLSIIDKTITAMGTRLLKKRLLYPLNNKKKIEQRLNVVNKYFNNPKLLKATQESLKNIYDIDRLLSKITYQRANPNDLLALANSLEAGMTLVGNE